MNLRATFLVLISIPISVGIALMVMSWLGLSANLMSLGGIAVAIGMLVDGSVVMVENMFKHLHNPEKTHDKQTQLQDIPLRLKTAGKEVARPVFFAAAIILVVFTPLFSFEGVEAKLFQPMAISIILAVISAIFVALLVVPAIATFLFRKGVKQRESFILNPIDKWYRKSLEVAMKQTKVVIAASVVLLIGALSLLPQIGTEFVPELEEGTINLRATLAPSSSLETALSVSPIFEKMLMEFP